MKVSKFGVVNVTRMPAVPAKKPGLVFRPVLFFRLSAAVERADPQKPPEGLTSSSCSVILKYKSWSEKKKKKPG